MNHDNVTKSCTSIILPIHLNREMASVCTSISYSSLTTNLKYTAEMSRLSWGEGVGGEVPLICPSLVRTIKKGKGQTVCCIYNIITPLMTSAWDQYKLHGI